MFFQKFGLIIKAIKLESESLKNKSTNYFLNKYFYILKIVKIYIKIDFVSTRKY